MKANVKKLIVHLVLLAVLSIIGLFVLFNLYLPSYTSHGELITVPDLKGMKTEELSSFLEKHNLRYQITDSLFNATAEPGTVLGQRPISGKNVKENRMIYLSINTGTVPIVVMPVLKMTSLINATMKLDSVGLFLNDSLRYRYSNLDGMVLEQLYNNERIESGTELRKGSMITLVIGRKNLNAANVEMSDVMGLPLQAALRQLQSIGLEPIIAYDANSNQPLGIITRQGVEAGKAIKKGSFVDVWVSGTEPVPEDENDEETNNE